MQLSELWTSLQESLGGFLPTLLGALAILLIGWILAAILRAGTRRALGWVGLNRRVATSTDKPLDLESGLAQIVFFVVVIMALLAFLNALQLDIVSGPVEGLMNEVMEFLPRLVAAGILMLVAWVIATAVRAVSRRALSSTGVDAKLDPEGKAPLSATVSNVLYALIFVLFLPAILGALQMEGILAPVESMTADLLAVLPNLFAAGLIGVVGWFVARLVRDLATGLLRAAGADRLGERAGMTDQASLAGLGGTIVYVLVLIPAAIAALQALQIEAIAEPATLMLTAILEALPRVFAAALILGASWLIARLAGDLLRQIVAGAGVDRWPARMGLQESANESGTVSRFVGNLVVYFVMLFASIEAAYRLGFTGLSEIFTRFVEFSGQVLLGSAIIALGFWLATLARRAVLRVSGPNAEGLANVLRFAILGMILAMGLRAMGLADDIVNLAFGLTLGAMAVAFAIAFGFGGREAASRLADTWVSRVEKGKASGGKG